MLATAGAYVYASEGQVDIVYDHSNSAMICSSAYLPSSE